MVYTFLAMAVLAGFMWPLIDLRNSSYEISPLPSLSKTFQATDIYFLSSPILKSFIAFSNSSLSKVFELLSSAILNFLPIPEIPLAPLEAIFYLIFSITYFSVAFYGTPASYSGFFAYALPKILLSYLALGPSSLFDHPLVPSPFLDSSVNFHALLIMSMKYISSSMELEMLL